MQAHRARLQHHRPFISPRGPQVFGGWGGSWHIQPWPDVRVPPLLMASPLTQRAIWATESRQQAHPSPGPAPRGGPPASETAREGEARFDDSTARLGTEIGMSHFV